MEVSSNDFADKKFASKKLAGKSSAETFVSQLRCAACWPLTLLGWFKFGSGSQSSLLDV
jgi:hypothetical protein